MLSLVMIVMFIILLSAVISWLVSWILSSDNRFIASPCSVLIFCMSSSLGIGTS